jgi:signal transduction histidine kinase
VPKETIVVVDDEPAARTAVARLLQERGYTVHALTGGQEAIDFANTTPFDVLLTDFRMPGGLDGLTTVRAVRRIIPQVVAIIMTGHSSIDLAIESLKLGVHGFVVKPFTAFELIRNIEQTIAQQTLSRENIKMRALVDVFSTTEALLSANTDAARLPRLTLELAMDRVSARQAGLLLLSGDQENQLELAVIAQRAAAEEDSDTNNLLPPYFPPVELFIRSNSVQLEHLRQLGQQVLDSNSTKLFIDGKEVALGSSSMVSTHSQVTQVAVPLMAQGRKVGALVMEKTGAEENFTEVDLQIAAILASQGAIAIDNSRLMHRLAQVEALHQADRLRSEFVAMVSHELRTPLTSIKGYATTLLRPDVQWNNQTGTEYLSIISEECDKLMQLIDNILEVSRIEAGALRIYPEPIQIYEVLDRAATETRRRSPEVNLEVKYPPVNEIPYVQGDSQRIIQVLRNLIQNAIKYTPQDPHILLELSLMPVNQVNDQEMVQIKVQDNGIGLTQENKDRIFERFYRVDTGSARRTEGTGLGLAICRGIVEAHGGRIWVESAGRGKGSAFYFTLPVADISNQIELD